MPRVIAGFGEEGLPGPEFVSFLYQEIRAIARMQLARERPHHTLSATALVNELYLRLAKNGHQFASGREFIPAAAHMIRQILLDYARARGRLKRGSPYLRVQLDETYMEISPDHHVDIEVLDDALNRLAKISERQARVVELRFFGGLSVDESAASLGVSPKTIKRDWVTARAWLRSCLRGEQME